MSTFLLGSKMILIAGRRMKKRVVFYKKVLVVLG